MPKSAKRRTPARKRKPAAKRKAKTEQPPQREEAAYVETVIASGEAARLDKQGRLPPGATHKIVEDEAGNVKVVRRRVSIS